MSKPVATFNLPRDLWSSLTHPGFWAFAAWLDIVSKYRRSRLGVFWLAFPPVATFCILGYFYAGLTGREPGQFIPFMGFGYALWRFVTQVIGEASGSMLANRPFIMDGRTRLTDYVLRCISKSALYFMFAFVVLIGLVAMLPDYEASNLWTLPITLPVFLVNLFCLGMVLALLGARFPDMHEFTTTIFIFGFLLTPILWYPESLPPGGARWYLMQSNPAFHLIELVRGPALGRGLQQATVIYVGLMTCFAMGFAAWLYRRFGRFVPIWT